MTSTRRTAKSPPGLASTDRSLRGRKMASLSASCTHIGDPFQLIDAPPGETRLGTEKAIELNYALQVKPYFLWQPVFQYYVNVGGNSRIPNAALFGFRTKVNF
jgi:carbohydrate-selective porin OprB